VRENLGPRQMADRVDSVVTVNRRGRGTQVCRYKIPLLKKAITRMRRLKKVKRSDVHKPVGQMKAPDVIDYLYDMASTLHWNGRISEEMLLSILPPPGSRTVVVISGPTGLNNTARRLLRGAGYSREMVVELEA
jgi:hypothetical protein